MVHAFLHSTFRFVAERPFAARAAQIVRTAPPVTR
jgi:hypothetical protein